MNRRLILACILAYLFPTAGVAGDSPDSARTELLTLSRSSVEASLSPVLGYTVDPRGTMGPTEAAEGDFRPLPMKSLQIPRSATLWLRAVVENRTDATEWVVENAQTLESITLYHRSPATAGASFAHAGTTGDSVPFTEKEMQARYPAFRIHLEPGQRTELLFRVEDLQSSSVQLRIVESARFMEHLVDRNLLLGLAFGFFAALVIYNLIVYLINRDSVYLLYSLYMGAFFWNQSTQERLFARYVNPDQPYGFFWFTVFAGLTAILGIFFIRRFLETRARMPRLDRIMLGISGALALVMASALFGAGPIHADILNVLSLLVMLTTLTSMIRRMAEGYVPALVCLIGTLAYFAGTTVEIVSTFVPVEATSLVRNAQLFGALAQVLILSVALGQKTRLLRRSYEAIQRAFTRSLEEEVTKRTRELENANRKLSLHVATDALTGVYNRGELDNRVIEQENLRCRAIEGGNRFDLAIAYLDLDNFKFYNDTFGHPTGDRILADIAASIVSAVRGSDVVFRVGGDEFLVLMPNTRTEDACRVAERILESTCSHWRLDGQMSVPEDKRISCSIGVAAADADRTASVEELVSLADSALLEAKQAGKHVIVAAGLPFSYD